MKERHLTASIGLNASERDLVTEADYLAAAAELEAEEDDAFIQALSDALGIHTPANWRVLSHVPQSFMLPVEHVMLLRGVYLKPITRIIKDVYEAA